MNRIFAAFFQKLTFQRQLGITVTLGILLLALLSSIVGSWQGNKRVRDDLIEQGRRITENLARQSALALVFDSADNAEEAVNATLAFPGVVGVKIFHADGRLLLSRGDDNPNRFLARPEHGSGLQAAAVLDVESADAWLFAAPVYSQPFSESPFGEAAPPELLGRVSVAMSKAAMDRLTTDIFITNLTTSLSFALLFLLLIRFLSRNMARPLDALSDSMERAQMGESQVRAKPGGPKDIAAMAYAFNNMMSVQEEREAALRIAAIAFETDEGMMVTDENGIIIRVNQAFTRLTGYSAEEAISSNPSMLKSDRQDDEFYRRMWESLHREKGWQGEIWNRRKNGEIYPEWLNITAVVGKDGKVTNYVGTFIDFTERKQAENEIHHLAYYDTLCQLPNRRLLLDRLRQAVATGARNQSGGALLFIDLDNFKTLNDTKGHGIGDLLLIEAAKRLQACLREGDTVARFGGDEFVLVLEGLSNESAQAAVQARGVGEKVLETLNRPYILEGNEFHSSSSMGITLFINYRQELDELLKQADTAMYEAKKSGRNTLRFFDPAMQEELEVRAQLEAGLREALRKQQFRLYYQMQVNHGGRILGAEVLLRWIHPERGLISPLQFIPLAEETGLIIPIGKWVLENACLQLKAWEADPSTRELQLAVNVSGRQFRQPDFVAQVSEILGRTAIDPMRLKLELTESIVLDNVDDTIAKMHALRQLGVSFSMDDFGTGYSSLAYLTQLPLNQLKIDKSFVQHIGSKASDATIIQTIIGMASNLGMEVIAEGVETQEQRDFLEANGCMLYQGYLFGKPIPFEEFDALLGLR
ncbi:MAG: EAL domain-containing protein [Gallionella sp.]|jgi:diguanylate cyclase (GGDEF)-like protein/PAS domain S-box-containing protein|nr:EAL domain-containing protein [Gallionella sp.]MCK9353065.1 EAL domain-containing protein [Gallionella sp.]